MSEEPFLLVSLDEEKAKALAQVLSNDTSRKILNFLSKVDHATETQISKELSIPLSTAHYNLSLLLKTNLVSDENFSYSEKGKEIIHYSLSNKYVIIAPKNKEQIKEKLIKFLPVVFISGLITIGLKYFNSIYTLIYNYFSPIQQQEKMLMAQEISDFSLRTASSVQEQDFAFWFLIGSLITLVIYFLWAEVILKKIIKKKN
ncbi:MAG: winged helix-turn-helix domain-containing protein [Candidatus Woesearchaeota archaeon]